MKENFPYRYHFFFFLLNWSWFHDRRTQFASICLPTWIASIVRFVRPKSKITRDTLVWFSDRLPRRSGDDRQLVVLVDSDLSRLPLPDLVLSAVEQLPPPTPQVTVSAPSSPTRDAAFQFPECSGDENGAAPVPSPRPRPRRRRLASEGGGATMKKGPATERICKKCCGHLGQAFNESQWASVGANLRNIADDFHASQTKVSRLSDQLG